MKIDGNDSAHSYMSTEYVCGVQVNKPIPGLTKHEYIAIQMMASLGQSGNWYADAEKCAEASVRWADTLIKELNKHEEAST